MVRLVELWDWYKGINHGRDLGRNQNLQLHGLNRIDYRCFAGHIVHGCQQPWTILLTNVNNEYKTLSSPVFIDDETSGSFLTPVSEFHTISAYYNNRSKYIYGVFINCHIITMQTSG